MPRKAISLPMIVGALFIATSQASAQTSYVLSCKGGGAMTGEVAKNYIAITFRRGTQANNPGAGECVWLDRAFRSEEPNTLTYTLPSSARNSVTVRFAADATIQNIFLNEGSGSRNVVSPYESMTGGASFLVHAYRSGNTMVVTRVGP